MLVNRLLFFSAFFSAQRFPGASKQSKIKDNRMRQTVTIRTFRLSDMDRILEIERASFGRDAYDRNLFAEFFHTCGGLFLVAVGEDRIWGYVIAGTGGQRPPERAELVSIAVDPAARGRGVASALMRNVFRRLRRRRVGRVTLVVRTTNRTARNVYEHYGFEKVRRIPNYYRNGQDGELMRKLL